MERSLTVLLPVRNSQASLSAKVDHILDVLADLSRRFEVLIVDDGSTDATSEVASELSRRFPQVRTVCHTEPMGRDAAVRTGIQHSHGELVVLEEQSAGAALEELRRQWRRDAAVLTRGLPTPAERLATGSKHSLDSRTASGPARPNFLARIRDFALGE